MEVRADLSTRPCIPVCSLEWGIRELGEKWGKKERKLEPLNLFYKSGCQTVPSNTP